MPAPPLPRALTALLAFIAAAVAGWLSAPEPPASPGMATAIAARAPSPRAKEKTVMTPAAEISRLEREFLLTLDPDAAGPCNGERLRELLRNIPFDGPAGTRPFAYAKRWAAQAPQEMFDWLQSHGGMVQPMGDGRSATTFITTLFHAWAQRDPDKALAAALQVQGQFERPQAIAAVIESTRKTDPSRALTFASANMATLATGRIGYLSAQGADYRQVWNLLRQLPPGPDRGTVLANFYDDICRYHTADSAPLWQETPEAVRREMSTSGYNRMFTPGTLADVADYQRAHVEATGDQKIAGHFLQNEGHQWARRDPAAAIAWAQQHLKGRQRVEGTAQLFRIAAVDNFDATLQVWHSLPEGLLRARAAGHLAAVAPTARVPEIKSLLESLSPADRAAAGVVR